MFSYFTRPKGPCVNRKTETVTLTFSGTKVRFKAPGYSYVMIDQDEDDLLPVDYDLDDFSQYRSVLHGSFNEEHPYDPEIDIAGFGCFKSVWSFRKPLLGDKYDNGTLAFVIGVDHIARFGSLFKPQNMEKAAIECIDLMYGPKGWLAWENLKDQRFKAPLNWRIHHFQGLEWIHYFINEIHLKRGGRMTWSIPLTEEHFLSFTFRDTGYPSEKLVKEFNRLAREIIETCEIDYSEAVQRQIKKAKIEGLGLPYSTHREPQVWEVYEQEAYDGHVRKYKQLIGLL